MSWSKCPPDTPLPVLAVATVTAAISGFWLNSVSFSELNCTKMGCDCTPIEMNLPTGMPSVVITDTGGLAALLTRSSLSTTWLPLRSRKGVFLEPPVR